MAKLQQHAVLLVLAALIVAHQPLLLTDAARVIINNAIAAVTLPTAIDVDAEATACKALASVCKMDKECCSESCLLFVCVLPYEKKEMEGLVGNAARIISSNNKEIALQAIDVDAEATACKALASVCKMDKECCSESCLLFVCVLPYEKKEMVGLVGNAARIISSNNKEIALQEKAPTCLPFGSACAKAQDCCSESCLLLFCVLPYDQNMKLEAHGGKKLAKLEKAPACLPFGGACTKDKDCCSDTCLLLFCVLPYEDKKAELPLAQSM